MVNKSELEEHHFGEDGWDCINHDGKIFNLKNMFAGFAPGTLPWQLPEDAGFFLGTDTALVASIHYNEHPDHVDPVDETKFDFHIRSEVENVLQMVTPTHESFTIPAGATGYAPIFTVGPLVRDWSTIYNILPHMHFLGRGFDVRVQHANGEETCVATGDFDFDNQVGYQLTEPVRLADDDTLLLSCVWDNPGENAVEWGQSTDEEMCIFFTIVGD